MTDETPSERNLPSFNSREEFFEAVEPILKRCPSEWHSEDVADYVFFLIDHHRFSCGQLPPVQAYQYVVRNVKPENCERLAAMPYQQFLGTRYWHAVRDYVLHQQKYRCQLCASSTHLQVHHRTYKHRGWEHEHLDDLTVLCQLCHQTFHDHREVNS